MGLSNYLPNSRISQPGVIPDEASRPASPFNGQVIYQQDTDRTLVWNGTAWVDVSTGKAGKPGLVLVKEQTVGTGVSTATITNVFSSDFEMYRVLLRTTTSSTAGDRIRYRCTGSTGATHSCNIVYMATVNTTLNGTNTSGITGYFQAGLTGGLTFATIDIMNPESANPTRTISHCTSGIYSATAWSNDSASIASTDLEFSCSAGTMTGGYIRVYGYN